MYTYTYFIHEKLIENQDWTVLLLKLPVIVWNWVFAKSSSKQLMVHYSAVFYNCNLLACRAIDRYNASWLDAIKQKERKHDFIE